MRKAALTPFQTRARLRQLWSGFCIAFSMYSIFPAGHVRWTSANRRYAFCFFPLVGIPIGLALFLWLRLCTLLHQPMLFAAGATAFPVLLSGGIHLDGFCDMTDALSAHASREKSLAIMKDSNAGAFAVIACVLWGIASFAAWHSFYAAPYAPVLILFVLSRAVSALGVLHIPCASGSGLAALFAKSADRVAVTRVLGTVVVLCACGMTLLSPLTGAACLVSVGVLFYAYRGLIMNRFGGITGDCAGWFLTLAELVGVYSAILIGGVFSCV